MLYLLSPDRRARWADLPHSVTGPVIRERRLDLSHIDWAEAELVVDETVMRLALRHGVVHPAGIVVDGLTLSDWAQVHRIREAREAASESLAAHEASNGAFLESVMPGWGENQRELNARVDESSRAAEAEAAAEVDEQLQAEPLSALVSRWRELGGILPEPL